MARKQKKRKSPQMARRSGPRRRSRVRRNAAPPAVSTALTVRNARSAPKPRLDNSSGERLGFGERIRGMNIGHVAGGAVAGGAGTVLGLIAAGQGWVSPEATSWTLLAAGALGTVAGYYWESDAFMAASLGVGTVGSCSLVTQWGVDAYEAIETHAEEKRAERSQKEQEKRLAEARLVLAAAEAKAQGKDPETAKVRNGAPRLVLIQDDSDLAAV